MDVAIVGCGYVGLVTGTCLASVGKSVACLDVDETKVDTIKTRTAPFYEAGLDELIEKHLGDTLHVSTDLDKELAIAPIILVCVGTPFKGEQIDLSFVLSVGQRLGDLLKERNDYPVLVIKSTVVPGTTTGAFREIVEKYSGKQAGKDFGLAMNPEFLAEGSAVRDFMRPDRIVIGATDDTSYEAVRDLYSAFDDNLIVRTSPSTAEMVKYTSNSLLATLISFSNEIASICSTLDDVDVADVMSGVHRMQHLTYSDQDGQSKNVSIANFLWAGCGFGGSCFPKDLKALAAFATSSGVDSKILNSVVEINEKQPHRVVAEAKAKLSTLIGVRTTVLGTAFKPGTDDVRESPALKIVAQLMSEGADVICHDPMANPNARQAMQADGVDVDSIRFTDDLATALAETQLVILVTSWPEYRNLAETLCSNKATPLVFDSRRFLDKRDYPNYAGIGLRS